METVLNSINMLKKNASVPRLRPFLYPRLTSLLGIWLASPYHQPLCSDGKVIDFGRYRSPGHELTNYVLSSYC